MKRTRIKSKPPKRTPAQADYARRNPKCRVCWRPGQHIHHIDRNRRNDTEKNFEHVCMLHHTGAKGPHLLGDVKFCEWFRLVSDEKWKDLYERKKSKQEFIKECERIADETDRPKS